MVKKIAFDIASFLVEEKIIDNDDREIYQYSN
jgi:thiamine kinase-like enzyme